MKKTGVTIMILGLVLFLMWGGIRSVKGIVFDINVRGHLKRAADANTIELATTELETVTQYLEHRGITEGYTNILWRTPAGDVGFWHRNLSASWKELCRVSPETTQLERTNILMKLRETLLDGKRVTKPGGLSIFPFNRLYCFWGWGSGFLIILGIVTCFSKPLIRAVLESMSD